jgi:hypothetical protein
VYSSITSERLPGYDIRIRPHAFHEPGGVKSVFYHEVAHTVDNYFYAAEHRVDRLAAWIAYKVYGHNQDIVLPFIDE